MKRNYLTLFKEYYNNKNKIFEVMDNQSNFLLGLRLLEILYKYLNIEKYKTYVD